MLTALGGLLLAGLLLVTVYTDPEHTTALAVAPAFLVIVPALAYAAWRVEPALLLSIAIVLSPLSGNWPQVGVPGALAPDRLILIAGIASVLLRAPAMRDRGDLRLHPVHWLMAAALAYVAISALISGTLTDLDRFAQLFDSFGVTPFLVFLVAPFAFRERRQRDMLLVALVIFGGYLGLTTLFERLNLDALVFPKYILDPAYGIHADRGRGPFVEAVTNGFALYMCVVVSAIAYKQWRGRPRADAAAAVALVCVAGIVLALERSVWVAATAGTIVTVLTLRSERRAAIKALVAIVIAVGISILTIPGLANDISERVNDQRTVHDRENLSRAAFNMIEDRPLLGFGWGEFVPNSFGYFEQADDYPLGNIGGFEIHSTLLIYLVELGMLGTGLWLAVVILGVLGGLPRRGPPDLDDWRTGLVAIAVAYALLTNFVPPQVFPNLALWLFAGIAWVGYQGESD